ncbi:uncharacterized protein K444DRAFT_712466 [Hyaloscypha bicolor E]|uniref:Uncharacterized protein n=1 Tax=Hyaloscypha bicolor E TaxID=1095630 RepID=A0A2J6SFL2_9HELO|nr:uncharacterized protein K444DRAFT_712466 [Hyaloscypha bicolor E]PMD49562.1 hypothetical protein K444DRAFT_712466 [Hyaloscypha bicolor E]
MSKTKYYVAELPQLTRRRSDQLQLGATDFHPPIPQYYHKGASYNGGASVTKASAKKSLTLRAKNNGWPSTSFRRWVFSNPTSISDIHRTTRASTKAKTIESIVKDAAAKKGSGSKEEIEATLKAKESTPYPYSIKKEQKYMVYHLTNKAIPHITTVPPETSFKIFGYLGPVNSEYLGVTCKSMHGFHREKNTEFSNRRPMVGDTHSHTGMREDEEWKYENNLPNRLDPIEEHFGDDDDSEEENSGDVDSEDRVSENERY